MTCPDESVRFIPREPEQPPSDSRAEDALLCLAYIFPEYVGLLELNGHLHLLEHQLIWQAMIRVHMRTPGLDVGAFWLALRAELHDDVCRTRESHADDRQRCDGWRYLQVLSCDAANPKDVDYWMSRLRRCTDARRLIDDGAEQVARAWRGDIEGALAIARRAAMTSPAIRIDIV